MNVFFHVTLIELGVFVNNKSAALVIPLRHYKSNQLALGNFTFVAFR